MANRTDPLANSVSGTDPQNLLEYITRQRVYDSRYWKEDCFGLSVEDVLEKSCGGGGGGGGGGGIRYVGGYPTPFLALTLKLLQLHPEPELVAEAFVRQRQFKYARALGCLYLRLTGRPVDIYESLEPLYGDYRKLRFYEQTADVRKNEWTLVPVDAFVHRLLTEPRAVGIALPRLPPRRTLVDAGYLPDGPRPTPLEDKLKRFGGGGDNNNNNNNNDDGDDDDDGNNYGSAAVGPLLALLEHKASVEKSPFAVEALERRRRRRKAGGFVGGGGEGEDDGDGELLLRDEKNEEEDEDGDAAAAGTSRRPKKKRRETKPDREEVEDDDRDGDDGNRRGVEDESAGKDLPTKEEERKQEKKKKNKKKDKKRNYENLFKKGGNGTTTSAAAGEQPTDEPQQQQQQQSDEYWNEERAKLGLKPLR